MKNPATQADKYAAMRQRFPAFNHPEIIISRVEQDSDLQRRLIQRFNEIDPYRRRYAKAFLDKYGRPDYKTVPGNRAFEKDKWKERLTDDIFLRHLLGDNLALAICFTDPKHLKLEMAGRTDTDTRFMILDLDIPDFDVCEKVAIELHRIIVDELQIPCHLSFSGSKGVHIEFYLDHKVSSSVCDDFRSFLLDQYPIVGMYSHLVETYKEDHVQVDIEVRPQRTAGHAAKFALGVNPKSGMFCGFLSIRQGRLCEIEDSHEYFISIPHNAPATRLEAISVLWREIQERRSKDARAKKPQEHKTIETNVYVDVPVDMKPAQKERRPYEWEFEEHDSFPDLSARLQHILEHGLLPGKERHDTTFLLLRYLRLTHSRGQAFKVVKDWSEQVLYPKCGHHIETDIVSHLNWVRQAIDNLWSQRPKEIPSIHPITEQEFNTLVQYSFKPTKTGVTLDLPVLKVLLALYLYKVRVPQVTSVDDDPSEWVTLTYWYMHQRTGCSIQTVSRVLKRLEQCEVVKVRRKREMIDERWNVQPNRYRLCIDVAPGGCEFNVQIADLWNPHLVDMLLTHFYRPEELRNLVGGWTNSRKVNRILATIYELCKATRTLRVALSVL